MLSDMKDFTVRDLDRKPGSVLDACDRDGAVRIHRRNGQSYTIRPAQGRIRPAEVRRWLEQHRRWMRRTFPTPVKMNVEQTTALNRFIGSDDGIL